jgi:hypothetical protein
MLLGKFAKRTMHLEGGMHGARRIVFGYPRRPEDGEHPVAEKFGDRPAVRRNGAAHRFVVALHECAHRLCIKTLLKGG